MRLLPPYPEYQLVDTPWLRKAPAHWRALPLRRLGRSAAGSGFPHDYQGLSGLPYSYQKVKALGASDERGVVGASGDSVDDAIARHLGATVFPAGTLIYAKVGAALMLGRIRILGVHSCLDNNLAGFTPDESIVYPRFQFYAMSQIDFRLLVNPGAVPSVSDRNVCSFVLPCPPLEEQHVIADYLDRETAQIDALIGKQMRLIETLRERRAALVESSFAPSPMMSRTRVGDLLIRRPSYGVLVPEYVDGGVPFVRVGNLSRLAPDTPLPRISSEQSDEFARTRLVGGEILLGVVGNMGTSVVAPTWLAGANVARAVAVLRCRPDVDATLLNRWFGTRHFRDQAALATGSDTAQPTLGMNDLVKFTIFWPTESNHSAELARWLDEQTSKVDTLIDKAERFIELSKERRAALITAAVTGQIDVRDHAAGERVLEGIG